MPRPSRREQSRAAEFGIVHVVQRCVRRRMEAFVSVFAVDVLSDAVMSNHMHSIRRNRPDVVAAWTDKEVAIRWLRAFPGRRLEERLAEPNARMANRRTSGPL